ncbi:MAG TPA: energy transducer TonB [Rhizomicrobium sp.]|jgi:protein TonB
MRGFLGLPLAALIGLSPLAAFAQDAAALPAGTVPPSGVGFPRHACPPSQWYPRGAFAKNEGGEVNLTFRLDVDGVPKDVAVAASSGFADIDQAAAACVATFRYRPATRGGQPVEAPWSTRVIFDMPQDPKPAGPSHDCRDEAKAADSGGREVDLTVAADGSVKSVLFGAPGRDAAADQALLACMMQWRYEPAIKRGKPADFTWKMPFIALTIRPMGGF